MACVLYDYYACLYKNFVLFVIASYVRRRAWMRTVHLPASKNPMMIERASQEGRKQSRFSLSGRLSTSDNSSTSNKERLKDLFKK